MDYITVAIAHKSFGLKGEIRCESLTSFPELRFKLGNEFFLYNSKTNERKKTTLKTKKFSSGILILGFDGINSPEEADLYRECQIQMDKEKAPVPSGHYRYSDMIGYSVLDENGVLLGVMSGVEQFGPNPNLIVKRENNKAFRVPFVDAFVKSIDEEGKKIIIEVWEGML